MNTKSGIYIRNKFHKKRWRQFAFIMACMVVFCTTYALLLPAVTLEKTAACGLEEHQHEESCYEDQLVCGQEESGEHRHTDICYRKILACGKEVHVHSSDCFQDKVMEGAMDGGFPIDNTGEETEDAGEETGTSLLEEAEGAGYTAVNEQAADSALDLEAEESGQEVEETAGEAKTLSEDVSEEEAVGEEQAFSEQLPREEDAGEAQSLSEETAGEEAGLEEENSAEEAGSDEENSSEEADAAENQFSEEGFEEGENLKEETEETVGGETGSVEENPAGETGSVEESPSGEAETTQEQSSAAEAAGEAETHSEETVGENAGATTEQSAPDEMTEAEAAPVQGVAADLACQGQDYEVTVKSGEEAGIPGGASLSVTEIMPETSADNTDTELAYEEYLSLIGEALGLEEVSDYYIRLFDIKIVDVNGEKIKIQAPVYVKIQLTDQDGSNVSNAQIVHFADEADETDITEETNGTEETSGIEGETNEAKGETNGTESAYGADSINETEGTDPESVTPPAGSAKKTLKARKTKSVKQVRKAQKEKKGDVIQDVTVESGRTMEDGTTLSFEANGFSVFAVVGTTIEKYVLASDGHNYKVTVTYGQETEIPENADLAVEEITKGSSVDGKSYEDYVTYTENALGMEEGSTDYIRLFDISIVDKDNPETKYQPAEGSNVGVRIELADSSSDSLNVVHFADGAEEGEKVQSSTENGENGSVVEFQADGFSVYSIVDAPEPIPFIPTGWYQASSLDQIEELGNDGFYLSHDRYYFTGELIHNVTGNSDRDGLGGTLTRYNPVPEDVAEKFYFVRQEGTDTFKIYTKGEGDTKKYVKMTAVSGNNARAGLTFVSSEAEGTAFTVVQNGNTYYISAKVNNTEYWWNRNKNTPGQGAFVGYKDKGDQNTAKVMLSYYYEAENDIYKLDGKTFGIAYHNDSVTAAALTAEKVVNQNRLEGLDMLMRADVLSNKGILLVAENSDIQEWTFEAAGEDKYYIKTTVEGTEKYLRINGGSVTLVDTQDNASMIKAAPGTDSNSGKWHFTVGNHSLNFSGSAANGFNAVNNSNSTTWLNLVEKTTLSDDDFVEYSARKISASDDILSATEKDDNGDILIGDDGKPVYRSEKTRVVIYTRVWNDTTKKYEFYAVDHDGSLVRVYDSGDQINWVGNKVNSALWEFTEYTDQDGTPTYFYELENTAYAGKYLAPQSEGIISDQPVGINLSGRKEGFDYTSIVAWDDPAYAYSGLKIERDENGSLRAVTCSLDEADDFHFAVITPPVEEADPTTEVDTVDNDDFGISIKMIDFNNTIDSDNRDTVQRSYLGYHKWDQAQAYNVETGLVSTNLTGGYPTITAQTAMIGHSLSGLFNNMTPANHLFIQSVYNESGYFEYDSTQNFAHYNTKGDKAGNFTVYNQLGAIGTDTRFTRIHGQFMPYNDISAETGYAHDTHGNIIRNLRDIRGEELPDTDPRKGEPLYSIPQNEADYFFGMELSAVFTQTPDGVDNWGHDIIFEFTGDDDFWFYVDGELVLDLGGVHSAVGGSVNFRTGEVICNGEQTTLYDVFKSNYQARNLDPAAVDDLFVTKTVNGETVHVFNDYTTHEMKMFYMERGAGASNLKMRFNLASVKPGTVELSKKLKGADNASNKLIQYPYQIWYQTAEYEQNPDGTYVLNENGQRNIIRYGDAVPLEQPPANTNLTGQVYAVYKGTKKLIPYKDSMTIGGKTYNHVFLLRAGETAVINFPEDTYKYKLVECGVDTSVYENVYINGDKSTNEIFGKPHNNSDGWEYNSETGQEIVPTSTTTYEGTARSDFGITYYTTEGRPRAEYTNKVPPEVMRTLSLKKVLYDSEGNLLTDEQAAQITDTFTFRLYLGNEFADQENLLPADMYTYYVRGPGPDHNYCKWDKANKKFVSLDVNTFEDFKNLSETDQRAGTFTTSMYGSISKIPAGYTVEVRDLIVGTRYKVEELDREIPKGYTRREKDGYVRTDLDGGNVVYYTDQGNYGRHPYPEEGDAHTAEPISDTIASKTESPKIEIRNQEGWGLTAKKEWTDKDFIIHDPIYMAVYLDDGTGNPGDPIEGTVRRLNSNETEIYWFFPDLKIGDETYTFDKFIVREVVLTDPVVDENGVVRSYGSITPAANGGNISVSGKTYSGTPRTETYTVNYQTGGSTGENHNIRTDTVTNSRPGIQIYKTNWDGDKYLSGAVFTLKDSDGHDVGHATYTSDRNGLVTTAYLNEGVFTLNEIKTPTGYVALDQAITIAVTTQQPPSYNLTVTSGDTVYYITLSGPEGFYTSAEATADDMARITVKNRTVQNLKVEKVGVDGGTRSHLSGVHFALYDQVKDGEGHVRPAYSPKTGFEDLVTKDDGSLEEITMSLGKGTYYLREKEAPSGYKKLAEDLCFTIGEDGTVSINNAGYSNWLTKDTSVPGTISYQISIENTSLGITLRKTDESGKALPGSQFVLYKKNDTAIFIYAAGIDGIGENGLIDLTDKTEMTLAGMTNGIYKLSETKAPSGYIILTKDIYLSVSNGTVMLTDEDGTEAAYTDVSLLDDNTTIAVKNNPGASLPSTGGSGTGCFHILGFIMTTGAGLLFLLMRRFS